MPASPSESAYWPTLKAALRTLLRTIRSAITEAKTCTITAAGVPNPIRRANANVVEAVSSSTSPPRRGTEIGKTSPTSNRRAKSQNPRPCEATCSWAEAAKRNTNEPPVTVTSAR